MGNDISRATKGMQCLAVDRQVAGLLDSDEASSEGFSLPVAGRSDSSSLPEPTAKNVIIFDWDDTLLCSAALNNMMWSWEELKQLEVAAESALNAAMALGETLIVTNGNATWVHDSATRFLPGLLPTIAKVQVVSARAMFEASFPGDPFMWKRAAFKHLLTKERRFTADSCLNLVALGDQMPEIDAAHFIVKNLGAPSRAKTVKLKEQPSIVEVMGQLAKMEQELPRLVADKVSGEFATASIAWCDSASQVATGWNLTRTSSGIKSMIPSAPSLQDIWTLFA